MQPQITVVIPTFRRPKLLIRCLKALAMQDLDKDQFEVVVVSDGLDQETQIALLSWPGRKQIKLNYLQNQTNKGPAAARNLGWLSANSPLIAFTDDDCIPHTGWLSAFLRACQNEEYVAFTGKTRVPLPKNPTDFALNTGHLAYADFITANCACTKKALLKIGGFDERYKMAWREDSDLEFNLLSYDIPIFRLTDAEIVHPVRQAPWGVSLKEQKKGIYDALLFKKYPELYRNKIQSKPLWNYYLINLCWLTLITGILSKNKYLMVAAAGLLVILLSVFTYKRLKNSQKTMVHITEMFYTSILIPTVSVYWRIYGAIKYRVFFL